MLRLCIFFCYNIEDDLNGGGQNTFAGSRTYL